MENSTKLSNFVGGAESRTTISFGFMAFDEMLVWSYLVCGWISCVGSASTKIDFNTHLRTPFFDSVVVGPTSMQINLSLNEFGISLYEVISSCLWTIIFRSLLNKMYAYITYISCGSI